MLCFCCTVSILKLLFELICSWEAVVRRSSVKKVVLRNFTTFTGKHLCLSLLFNKVAGLRQNSSGGCFWQFYEWDNEGTLAFQKGRLDESLFAFLSALEYLEKSKNYVLSKGKSSTSLCWSHCESFWGKFWNYPGVRGCRGYFIEIQSAFCPYLQNGLGYLD